MPSPRPAGTARTTGTALPLVTTGHTADGARIELPSKWIAAAGRPESGENVTGRDALQGAK
ncbi:hypothetical protein [Streptomyces chiangmaiensis]|uniref:Uncharacterized protein n=1 Tax=Streptomyces chiangmaiensis TaxID=766497 RepID=A0ABU7FCW6_9ACTN|nr:hypothetical protein [Streptomyces chiangmaiensis]MED7822006.1 hypothetical protein [Streptomyces chiangmaiensis]